MTNQRKKKRRGWGGEAIKCCVAKLNLESKVLSQISGFSFYCVILDQWCNFSDSDVLRVGKPSYQPLRHLSQRSYITSLRVWASLVAQLVENPPAVRETWVPSLGWEDLLEKGKATPAVFWPGEFHGLCSPWCRKELDRTERHPLPLHFHWLLSGKDSACQCRKQGSDSWVE